MEWRQVQAIMELRDSGRVEEALEESRTILPLLVNADERAGMLANMLTCCLLLGRIDEARDMLNQLHQLKISDLETRLNAEFCEAWFLVEEGKLEEGLREFVAILERHGTVLHNKRFCYIYEDVQYRRALALVGLREFAEAIPILEEAILFPSLRRAADAQQAHFALGICYEETKAADLAKREFLCVINLDLKNDLEERARYRVAILYFKSHGFAQARQQLEMILSNYANGGVVPRKYVYEQLSYVCRHLGDNENAKRYDDLANRA